MKLQIVGFTIGILLLILGLALMVPAGVDYNDGHYNATVFMACSGLSIFFGGIFYLAFRNAATKVDTRQAFLLTAISWLVLSLFAALPFYFSDLGMSFTDAFFESVSGITTTGSTVLSGLDVLPRGILMWRAVMQWIGGIGVVAFAIFFLPFLRVGGMQLFRMESSDRSEKVLPRTGSIVTSLVKVYCSLTLLCAMSYYALGMTFFDAVTHAMTTVATGGYSTHDASFGYFDSYAIDMAGTVFMLSGGLPFMLYIKLVYHKEFDFHKSEEVRGFLALACLSVLILSLWLAAGSDYNLAQAFRYVSFSVMSVLTTCGFASIDYTLWGSFAVTVFLFLTYLGACTGSTSGGIKTMRLLITKAAVGNQIKSLIRPNGVFTIKYQGHPVDRQVIHAVLSFLCLFVTANVLLTLALGMTGLDFTTAISGAATALANVGPGVGDVIGPAGNFSTLPDSAKWLLCAGMLLGRLEIMAVLVILTPGFWKK